MSGLVRRHALAVDSDFRLDEELLKKDRFHEVVQEWGKDSGLTDVIFVWWRHIIATEDG